MHRISDSVFEDGENAKCMMCCAILKNTPTTCPACNSVLDYGSILSRGSGNGSIDFLLFVCIVGGFLLMFL